jgi:adenine-specific DNA-methyltransferase
MATIEDVLAGRSLYHVEYCRAEEMEARVPDGAVSLVVEDWPYYGVKDDAWDNAWPSADAFLMWLGERLEARKRIMAPNGSLYGFASPQMGWGVEGEIRKRFSVLTNIVWRKETDRGKHAQSHKEGLREYFDNTERIIFAEQYGADSLALGESQYGARCDELRGFVFEPLRAYLDGERARAGFDRAACDRACGNQMSGHYFSRVQWAIPTQENYEKLRVAFNSTGCGEFLRREYEDLRREYEDLRREYEDLRREYEDLRRPFTVTADVPYTDVWEFPTVQSYPGKHPCEKPAAMAEHIILASSRQGDVVLDCFAGSGVFGAAAVKLGRRYIGCDASEHWAEFGRNRCASALATGRIGVRRVAAVKDARQGMLF